MREQCPKKLPDAFFLVQLLPMSYHSCEPYSIALRTGNYDTYVRTRTELEENQMKQWQKEQDQVRPSHRCVTSSLGFATQPSQCMLWSQGVPTVHSCTLRMPFEFIQ